MTWVYRAERAEHRCAPPRYDGYVPSPMGRLGDLWRCDVCGVLWRVGRACGICDRGFRHVNGQCAVGLMWRLASWWQRWRFRRVGKLISSPIGEEINSE
jgi:hypothetical protein